MLSDYIRLLKLTATCVITIGLTGCFSLPQVETPIHQGPQGTVILSTFPESHVIASHPTSIDPLLLRAALHGLRVKEDKGLLASLVSGESQMQAVFTEQELSFLLPHLSQALSQATPEEYISFLVNNNADENPMMTKGSLFRTRNVLRLGLESFQMNRRQLRLSSKASFSPTRVTEWTLGFFPAEASIQEEGKLTAHPIRSKIGSVRVDLNALHNITQTQRVNNKNDVRTESEFKERNQDKQHIQGLEKEIGELQEELQKQNQKLKQIENRLE